MKNRNTNYLLGSMLLLLIEILIALFAHDDFIRPILGDYIATLLVFCLLASFMKLSITKIAVLALVISYTIEGLQYLSILKLLRLDKFKMLNIVVGNSFSWIDMLAYTMAIVTVLSIHNYKKIKS